MHILDTIVAEKRKDLEIRKDRKDIDALEKMPLFRRSVISAVQRFRSQAGNGIIAEFKRKSPSKGIINDKADVQDVVTAYEAGGATAVSVLTNQPFFGGSDDDLLKAREVLSIPLLRKEFIVDEYQVYESRALGADMILLIAACLTPEEVKSLSSLAHSLDLDVLLELHDESELGHITPDTTLVGINNRNLKTFEVDMEKSFRMAAQLPAGCISIAESGISQAGDIVRFRERGYQGFLMGEYFMKQQDPGLAFRHFAEQIKEVPS